MADDLSRKKRKIQQKDENKPKRAKTSKNKKPGFDEDIYKETEYYFKNGLRHVQPYPFTFKTYCKGRWLRRKLIDVLSQEFQAETAEYYRHAIQTGNITVNGEQVEEDLILKDNDVICHKVHRHEPPVTAEKIQIIADTDDLVVVNKPSSIPIHPCGRYRHNTLVFLLGREFGFTNLYTIHRIDRLTSGIVMFAKSLGKAQELEKELREHKLQKEYVCKVQGKFPSGVVDCNEPITVVSHKVGVCRVHASGKPCRTVFTRETFDGENSIVKCQPHTGRMHQIRVHLQWLGHPIIDDPIYNHKAWGLAKGGVKEEDALKVIESIAASLRENDDGLGTKPSSKAPNGVIHSGLQDSIFDGKINEVETDSECRDSSSNLDSSIEATCQYTAGRSHKGLSDKKVGVLDHVKSGTASCTASGSLGEVAQERYMTHKVPSCTECQLTRRDPTHAELTMCLHAALYKGSDWEFSCPWPSWTNIKKNRLKLVLPNK